METLTEKTKYSYGEYLELERSSEVRYEFWNGEVFAMAGGTKKHNRIIFNIAKLIDDAFGKKGCNVFQSDIKLELEKENYYVYPDLILSCDVADDDSYVVRKPSLIVEVLSKTTETYDRSVKLAQYRKLKSLRYYLLVSQVAPYIEIYSRANENDLFTYDVAEGPEAVVDLAALDFALPVSKVYEYIEFGDEGEM